VPPDRLRSIHRDNAGGSRRESGVVRALRPQPSTRYGADAELVRGLRSGDPDAIEAFHDRYARHVLRVLARILGVDRDLVDLQHDVFVRVLDSIATLIDPSALHAWVTSIAVLTAKGCIQRRARRRWLRFFAPEDVPEVVAPTASEETQEALRATYKALEKLPADERIAFALRIIDGMELSDVASACDVSLATIKRRIARGEALFTSIAREDPVLSNWLEGGSRWADATR
jgi:RNA polymerase sigma-70 factor (ECF subfamily)